MTLGLCERYREKPKEEEAAFRRALGLEPGRPDASLQLAWRLETSGSSPQARDVLLAVAEDRRDVGHWMALGRLAAADGKDGVARDHWTRAVILLPNEPSVYQGLWNSTALRSLITKRAAVGSQFSWCWRSARWNTSPTSFWMSRSRSSEID